MSFWEHIDELRMRVLKSLLAFIICALFSYLFSDKVLLFLLNPLNMVELGMNIQVLSVTSMFVVKISIAILGGIILSLPVLIYQFWMFFYPALPCRKISIAPILLLSLFFSLLSIIFSYTVIIPNSLKFFTSMNSGNTLVNYNFTLNNYIGFVSSIFMGCCLVFQLPVITIIGSRIGIFTPYFLRHYRKIALIIFIILSAIITPPDPLSQLFMFFPLVMLYEFSILISTLFNKKR